MEPILYPGILPNPVRQGEISPQCLNLSTHTPNSALGEPQLSVPLFSSEWQSLSPASVGCTKPQSLAAVTLPQLHGRRGNQWAESQGSSDSLSQNFPSILYHFCPSWFWSLALPVKVEAPTNQEPRFPSGNKVALWSLLLRGWTETHSSSLFLAESPTGPTFLACKSD